MTLDQLKTLMQEGKFHHATYRTDFARGLHVYKVPEESDKSLGFRGFVYVGMISEREPECKAAYELTRKTGVSLGSYGNG